MGFCAESTNQHPNKPTSQHPRPALCFAQVSKLFETEQGAALIMAKRFRPSSNRNHIGSGAAKHGTHR